MRILNLNIIDKFKKKHSTSKSPLDSWVDICKKDTFNNLIELQATFPGADHISPHFIVFIIGGNNYRLLVIVEFKIKTFIVKWVGTHGEYTKGKHLKFLGG